MKVIFKIIEQNWSWNNNLLLIWRILLYCTYDNVIDIMKLNIPIRVPIPINK